MSIKDNFPAIRPSLNLDFANTKTLDPRITFSRASTGTYYDGVTHAKAEENLLTYSEEFDNAVWEALQSTISANATTSPDGQTNAESVLETAVTNRHGIYYRNSDDLASWPAGSASTLSTYVKDNGRQYFYIYATSTSGPNANFIYAIADLQNGLITDSGSNGTSTLSSSSISAAGNGWYRVSISGILSATASSAYCLFLGCDVSTRAAATILSGSPSYLGDITKGFYIWGAQLEQRSSVTAYTATTTQPITNYIPVLQSAAAGEARFDHDPVTGESKGLLIEEQRTNALQRSEEFDNAYWTKDNSAVTANTIVAPDGTLTGDKLVENTATNSHSVIKTNLLAAGTTYTASIFAKKAERNYLVITGYGGSAVNLSAEFDLNNGVVSKAETGATGVIQFVGNGWYRCSMTFTLSSTPATDRIIFAVSDGGDFNDAYGRSYTGDGYSGIYIWGAQLEAGTFPTSYIKTTSAQATRSADSASMTGTNFSEWYRQDAGSMMVETQNYSGNITDPKLFTISDGTSSNRIKIDIDNGTSFRIAVVASGNPEVSQSTSFTGYASFYKAVMAYAVNDFKAYLDGGYELTDTSGVLPLVDRLFIGVSNDGTDGFLNGHIKRLTYYPARLTNAQLQALTEG